MREEYVLERIKQLLDERNWTLYRLAKKTDISYSTLSNTFQRNNVPSIPTLIRICEGFGITLADFFNEEAVEVKQLTVSDQEMLAVFHRLLRDDKKLVIAYMQGLLKMAGLSGADDEEIMKENEEMVQENDAVIDEND